MVTSDILDNVSPLEAGSDLAAAKFLRIWNGDWVLPKISHYFSGPGCCGGIDDACDQMFGAALGIESRVRSRSGPYHVKWAGHERPTARPWRPERAS